MTSVADHPVARRAYRATFPFSGTLAATAYGALVRRRRFGSRFRRRLTELLAMERLETSTLVRLSQRRALDFARRALETIPAYRREILAALGARFEIRSHRDFLALPVVEKHHLRLDPNGFLAAESRSRPRVVMHTSGTTGTALNVHISLAAYQDEYAFTWLHRAKVGVGLGDRTATLAGHQVVPIERSTPPFWVINKADRQTIFSSYHLTPDSLPHYVDELRRMGPSLVHGYPSSLAEVGREILRLGVTDIRPAGVFPASETLLSHQREIIARAFGCPVLSWYGNTEMAGHVTECERGRLHVQHAHSHLEILDDEGRLAEPGIEGDLVATAFLNEAMPLVRYRTGDRGVRSGDQCPCGRGGQVLDSLTGRTDDILETPDGRRVGRLDHVFKGLHPVREGQVEQTRRDRVVLRVVVDGTWNLSWERRLRQATAGRLGPSVSLDVQVVDRVPRTAGGKFRAVIPYRPGDGA